MIPISRPADESPHPHAPTAALCAVFVVENSIKLIQTSELPLLLSARPRRSLYSRGVYSTTPTLLHPLPADRLQTRRR